jgi:hypothetical protein
MYVIVLTTTYKPNPIKANDNNVLPIIKCDILHNLLSSTSSHNENYTYVYFLSNRKIFVFLLSIERGCEFKNYYYIWNQLLLNFDLIVYLEG